MPTPRKTAATPAKKTPAKKAPTRRNIAAEQAAAAQPTGIAAKRAQMHGEDAQAVDRYAPTVWGAEESVGSLVDLELPSGQLCLVQRPGPEGLMINGMLDDLDMISTVMPKITGGKATQKVNVQHVMGNREMLKQTLVLVDRVVVHMVIKPELTPEPENPADKEFGKIYPSSISIEDRMFLFNWAVGGTRDLATFRSELQEHVAGLEAGEDVEGTTV